jgi:hypothetical protein
MRSLGTVTAAASLCALITSFGSNARAQAPATLAEVLFRDAQQLLAAGRIHEACEKFQASQEADPALGTLLNLAVCHEREGRTATAWLEYSEVASLAHRGGDTAREKYAQARLSDIEPSLHRVAVNAEQAVEGQVIWLDKTSVLPAAYGIGIPVDPGEHELRATAPGKAPWSWRFTTTTEPGTEQITIPPLKPEAKAVTAPPLAPAPAPATTAPPAAPSVTEGEPAPLDLRHKLAYGSAGVAAVGLGLGVYFGVSAGAHASRRDELCEASVACYSQSAFHEHHLAEVAQFWMLVTGGVGLAAAGAATALFLVPMSPKNERAATTWHAAPFVGPNVFGVAGEGRF